MIKNLALLSVLALLIVNIGNPRADSLFISVKGNACVAVTADKTRSSIRYMAYDKAALLAVKSSEYVRAEAGDMEEHDFNIMAYKLVDKALQDITTITVRDDNEKICLEVSGKLNKQKVTAILKDKPKKINAENMERIVKKVNTVMPKSIYETDDTIPLLYIDELKYYNGKTTDSFTQIITEKLAFEPRVLVTETKELADYILVPKLLLSKIEPISDQESRYSMSVIIELRRSSGELVDSEQQNRYIIITKEQDPQQTAHKLLQKLLEDGLSALSGKLNRLLKY